MVAFLGLNIERHDQLVRYLRKSGRIGPDKRPDVGTLTGGVSNRTVLLDRAGGEQWVVKQALPKKVLAGFAPAYDATVVRRLRDDGAIIVGKVTHEFAYGKNASATRNAWNRGCNPGGSSAGSGVSVAVRSAFGSIGTDSGGSVRVPAALNGVVGFKATYGRVSRHGVVPLSFSLDHVGPLARTVEDASLILEVIAGRDPIDLATLETSHGDFCGELEDGAAGLRIGIDREYCFASVVNDDVRAATLAVVDELRADGAILVETRVPELDVSAEAGLSVMLAEASDFHRHSLRTRPDDYDAGPRHMLKLGELVSASDYLLAQRARRRLLPAMRRVFDVHHLDALVAPTMPMTAQPVHMMPPDAVMKYSFPANLTGQPALSVPCGFRLTGSRSESSSSADPSASVDWFASAKPTSDCTRGTGARRTIPRAGRRASSGRCRVTSAGRAESTFRCAD
jgi:aspartyl-tRNA(Asn)/glutamyl-tRNA(Gln) amidotransferase subunit A